MGGGLVERVAEGGGEVGTSSVFLQKILTFLQKVVVSYRTRKSWWFPTEYAYLQKIGSLALILVVTRIFRVVSHIVRDCNARNVYSEFTSGHARSLFSGWNVYTRLGCRGG